MQMLETPIETMDGAALSRFFSTQTPEALPAFWETLPRAFEYSKDFSEHYAQLLPDGPAVILQAGLDKTKNLTELSEPHVEVATIVFDPSQITTRAFCKWRVTRTDGRGRTSFYLGVAEQGVIAARRDHDEQGRAQPFQPEDPLAEWYLIEQLASSSILKNQVERLKEQRASAERELRGMPALRGNYGPTLYDKRVNSLKDRVQRLAFTLTELTS